MSSITLIFFLASSALSSQPRVVHVNHYPELFIASKALSTRAKVFHVNHNLELTTWSPSCHPLP